MMLVKDLIASLICNKPANSKKAVVMIAAQVKLVDERMLRPEEESSAEVVQALQSVCKATQRR